MIKAFTLATLQAFMAMACENALNPSEPCTPPPKILGCEDLDWNCPDFPKLCDVKWENCAISNWRLQLEPYWKEAGAEVTFCKGLEYECYGDDADEECRCLNPIESAKKICDDDYYKDWNAKTKVCEIGPWALCEDYEEYTWGDEEPKCTAKWELVGIPEDIWKGEFQEKLEACDSEYFYEYDYDTKKLTFKCYDDL